MDIWAGIYYPASEDIFEALRPGPSTPILTSMDTSSKPTPRQIRHEALADRRRELILEAARATFIERGMDGASIREIARRAGYTPGAIYSYFDGKDALYGALLGESLERLNASVQEAVSTADTTAQRLQMAARAFFRFYRDHPQDLDLGFYLFQGVRPRGLTPELNEKLNARLQAALHPAQQALENGGLTPKEALQETTALFAHIVGLLVLEHSARIRMFGQEPSQLFEIYLDNLVARACDNRSAGADAL